MRAAASGCRGSGIVRESRDAGIGNAGIRDSGFGIRDSGFGIRDSGFGIRDAMLFDLSR
jgi:hypothetical protein